MTVGERERESKATRKGLDGEDAGFSFSRSKDVYGDEVGRDERGKGCYRPEAQHHRSNPSSILKDFIHGNEELIDRVTFSGYIRGDIQAEMDALNQIHWRSLRRRESNLIDSSKGIPNPIPNNKIEVHPQKVNSYAEITKTCTVAMNSDNGLRCGENSGKVPNYVHPNPKFSKFSIFIAKIPSDTKAKDLWDLFKRNGEVLDIILPRKKDKYNNRFGNK